MNIIELFNNVLDPYNVIQQATTRHNICISNSVHEFNTVITQSSIHNWETWFLKDINRVYSKGLLRRDNVIKLCSHPSFMTISSTQSYFVLAGLVIILQLYGDGNHRTGQYLYTKFTGLRFNKDIFDDMILCVNPEIPMSDKTIHNLIRDLLHIYNKYNT
jgi:hypothetical protein